MKHSNLKELLIQKVAALYDVENELVKALPKLARAATNQSLKEIFRNHLAETRTQVARLEQVFKILGDKPKKLKVDAIRGLIKDGQWVIRKVKPAESLDSNLVRVVQYMEHYEMAGYMGAVAWATTLGENKAASVLEESLREEQESDRKLADIGRELDAKLVNG